MPHALTAKKEDFIIHEAGHVVAAWAFDRAVRRVTFDHATWSGRTYVAFATSALDEDDDSDYARELAEGDVMILHAGMAAQRLFNYYGSLRCSPRTDLDMVLRVLATFERDPAVLLAWSTYVAERTLAFVRRPETWRRIEAVAQYLSRRSLLSRRQLTGLRQRVFAPDASEVASA